VLRPVADLDIVSVFNLWASTLNDIKKKRLS
jgi:hypothetical protein